MNLYTVPDVTFKPDFGQGEERASAMPWFRKGSVPCLVENPEKTGFLGKSLLSEQNLPRWGTAAGSLVPVGLKGSRAVVCTLPCKHSRSTQGCSCPASSRNTSPWLSTVPCRSSNQEATLQADSGSWGSKYTTTLAVSETHWYKKNSLLHELRGRQMA